MQTCQIEAKPTKAHKFRKIAETLGEQIAAKRAPRLENTPKRQREGMSARLEADNMERVQRALLALADGHEAGNVPHEFAHLNTKKDIEPLVTRLSESRGYYVVCSGEFRDSSPLAVSLRGYVDAWSDRFKEQDRERRRADAVREMENAVKFSDIPGFFPTPPELVQTIMDEAELEPGMFVLEPSAGKGDIADAAAAAGCEILCIERNYNLCDILRAKNYTTHCGDFLELAPIPHNADRVLMNPPFENGQDCEHVRHAYSWLKPGGRLVAIMAAGCMFNQARKFQEFREWFDTVGGTWYENDPDAFKAAFRQTSVRTITIVIDRK